MIEQEKEYSGYLGNPLLKKPGESLEFSHDTLQEYIKCMKDPIYFAEKYIQIVHVDKGQIPIKLYEYQKEIIESSFNNRFVIVNSSRQSGKCFFINTIVKVRNKKTGQIENMKIGDLYGLHKGQEMEPKKRNKKKKL